VTVIQCFGSGRLDPDGKYQIRILLRIQILNWKNLQISRLLNVSEYCDAYRYQWQYQCRVYRTAHSSPPMILLFTNINTSIGAALAVLTYVFTPQFLDKGNCELVLGFPRCGLHKTEIIWEFCYIKVQKTCKKEKKLLGHCWLQES
jgi:hypothetical protein